MNSISQSNKNYTDICRLASIDDNIFSKFKSDTRYTTILEHTSYEQGLKYLNNIQINFPEFIQYIDLLKTNDLIGSAKTYYYPDIGHISPSSLRYIKVLSDIVNIYRDKIDLQNKNIIEIGCGYGGQCLMLSKFFTFNKYYIVDIPEAQALISKYLKLHNVNFELLNLEDLSDHDHEYDLIISNYAYSELDTELQDYYYDNIIKKSKFGYLTLNFISHLFNINSYSKQELMNKIDNYKKITVLQENPETFKDNLIIYF